MAPFTRDPPLLKVVSLTISAPFPFFFLAHWPIILFQRCFTPFLGFR